MKYVPVLEKQTTNAFQSHQIVQSNPTEADLYLLKKKAAEGQWIVSFAVIPYLSAAPGLQAENLLSK